MSVQIPSKPGVTSIAAVGSSPNVNGGLVTGQTLTLEPADASNPGILSNTTQSIAGDKTFNGNATFTGGVGATSNVGIGVSAPLGDTALWVDAPSTQYGAFSSQWSIVGNIHASALATTKATAAAFSVHTAPSSSVGAGYGVFVDTVTLGASGTMGHYTGLYLAGDTPAGSSQSYAIFTAGTAQSSLGGDLAVAGTLNGSNAVFGGSVTTNNNNGFILQNAGTRIGAIYNDTNFMGIFSDPTNSSGFRVSTNNIPTFTINNSQVATFSGQLIGGGTTTNSSASSGQIGEYLQGVTLRASAISNSSSAGYFQVATITLTAGDWDVSGFIGLTGTSATITDISVSISTSSSSFVAPTNNYGATDVRDVSSVRLALLTGTTSLNNDDYTAVMPTYRASIPNATTQQIFLVSNVTFATGTVNSYGRLTARRAR